MDRRRFMKLSATGASGIIIGGASSCAWVPKLPAGASEPETVPDMETYLARVDAGMERIGRWSLTQDLPSHPDGTLFQVAPGDGASLDELGRDSLRTLYMTGMLGDLPIEAQLHPGMQERVIDTLPVMDSAVADMERFLATRSEDDLKRLQVALRHPSNPGMQIVEAIDENAALCGVSRSRRMQTRVLLTDAVWRMRNQPPALAIQETLRKVEKVAASDVPRVSQEEFLAAHAAQNVFWSQQQSGGAGSEQDSDQDEDQFESLRKQRLNRGARTMGIGLVVGGISLALAVSGAVALVFGVTVGAILFLVGLVTLLIGLGTSSEHRVKKTAKSAP